MRGTPTRSSQPSSPEPPAFTDAEARAVLTDMAHGAFERVEPARLAAHVLAVTAGADWPVRSAAMAAVLRRGRFAARDRLRVADKPRAGELGLYTTRRPRDAARPYATQLFSIEPLVASCSCPDFAHNGLGLCKHVLVVLDSLSSARRGNGARRHAGRTARIEAPQLAWDPVRPFEGRGDWLERVRYVPGRAPSTALKRLFERRLPDGSRALLPSTLTDPAARTGAVRELAAFVRHGGERKKLSRGLIHAALLPLLRDEQALLDAGVRFGTGELTHSLRGLRKKLYRYQREGVARFLEAGRLLLADDMGLGKTAQAIAACHALHRAGKVRRGLLLMPASLKSQWAREWRSFTDVPVTLVEGGPSERAAAYAACKSGFLIANYEQLLRDLPQMQAFAPDLVVLDEAQRIKNWESKTSMYVKQLDPTFRLVLTGTPMENRLDELASLMQWVHRPALEPAWRLTPWHGSEAGARHLDTLRARLAPHMLRRVRREVLDQLPSRTDTLVPVPLTVDQAAAHADLDQPIARLVAIARRRPLLRKEFLRLMSLLQSQRMICNALVLSNGDEGWPDVTSRRRPTEAEIKGVFSPKLLELRELLTALVVEQRLKVVVFSQWTRMLDLAHWACRELLENAGLGAVFFTGRESQKRRTQNVIDFHDDPAATVMFASDAGGVGLNLQRAASCCINLELPWNPAVLEQRIGRVYRLGQTHPVQVYNLASDSGIESRIATLVSSKRALFEGLFDGQSDEVLFDEAHSFMARIEQVAEPVTLPPQNDEDEEDEAEAKADAAEAEDRAAEGPRAEPTTRPPPSSAPPPPARLDLLDLVSQLDVKLQPGGGLLINAPPESASALASLLEGLAAQLRANRAASLG